MGVKKIRKRDGKVVDFDREKIFNAIFKAAQAVGGSDRKEAENVTDLAIKYINEKFTGEEIPTVEDIQDLVEKALIERGHATTAKAYILYRHRKAVEREMKKILGVRDDLKLPLNSIQVLERRYLRKDEKGKPIETPGQLFRRVATFIASAEKKWGADDETIKYYEDAFYEIMTSFEFLPNSPTLMNAGTELGQLSACFVIGVPDDIDGIFDAVKYAAVIHKSGGGTGFAFSYIRPRGDFVKSTAGIASGPLSFMSAFDNATDIIRQGGRRRGANMGVLHIWHPDIEEFITAKQTSGVLENFNVSVAVDDSFMKAVEEDGDYELINPRTMKPVRTVKARSLFKLIAYSAWKSAEPGILFIDEINRKNPTPKFEIHATNPCLVGDTLITTNDGLVEIQKLHNPYRVMGMDNNYHKISWAGETGEKKVFRVTTEAGYEVSATEDHKFYVIGSGWKPLKELKKGDKLVLQSKGQFGTTKIDKDIALMLGWLIGNGRIKDVKPLVVDKNEVPAAIFGAGKESVKYFLSALFGSNGSVRGNKVKGVSIRLASHSIKLLKQVQLLLLQFGIYSKISQHELIISKTSMLRFMKEIGFCVSSKNAKFEKMKPVEIYGDEVGNAVKSIEMIGIKKVFDATEPTTHSFFANGILVHNCGEVPAPDFESCNLGSINLAKFVEIDWSKTPWKKKINWSRLRYVVRLAVQFLDNVVELNNYPIPQIKERTLYHRRIGLGIMGFAKMLTKIGIRYDSEDAYAIASEIMKFITDEARKMSHEMGRARGSFPGFNESTWAQKYDAMRNATVTSIAPTGTISMIANTSSGIEPLFALAYIKTVMDGTKLYYSDEVFEHILKVRGLYTPELMKKVVESGTIQEMEEIPKEIRNVFVIAYDIKPEAHVKIQAAFQKYTDLAVSKTINLPFDATVEDVEKAYMTAWKLKCKGITIYRDGSRGEQVLSIIRRPKAMTADAPTVPQTPAERAEAATAHSTVSSVTL